MVIYRKNPGWGFGAFWERQRPWQGRGLMACVCGAAPAGGPARMEACIMELRVMDSGLGKMAYGKVGKVGSGKKAGTICFSGISKEWEETLRLGKEGCTAFEITGGGHFYYQQGDIIKEVEFYRVYSDMGQYGEKIHIEGRGVHMEMKMSDGRRHLQWYVSGPQPKGGKRTPT